MRERPVNWVSCPISVGMAPANAFSDTKPSAVDSSVPTSKKRPSCCAGNIPTEFGLCTALEVLSLSVNKLTGEHFFAQIDRMVYEFTTTFKRPPCCAGTIPTELGRCTAMKYLQLFRNGLTGKHFCAQIARRVYFTTTFKDLLAAQVQSRRSWGAARL